MRFESERIECENWQGNAVVNYTEREVPWTRIIEHKHFESQSSPVSVITREYPADWKPGDEPYYPINDERNSALYAQYEELAKQEGDVVFAGRLGGYKMCIRDRFSNCFLECFGLRGCYQLFDWLFLLGGFCCFNKACYLFCSQFPSVNCVEMCIRDRHKAASSAALSEVPALSGALTAAAVPRISTRSRSADRDES